MKDVPDDDKEDSFQGLSKAAIYVGEGPILYLQIMKTFAIMCILLVITNIPLFMMYSSITGKNVNFLSTNSLFEHFSLGNIGGDRKLCQVSYLDHDEGLESYPYLTEIELNKELVHTGPGITMNF